MSGLEVFSLFCLFLFPPFSLSLFSSKTQFSKLLTLLDVHVVGLIGAHHVLVVDLCVLRGLLERRELRAGAGEGGLGAGPRVLLAREVEGESVAGGDGGVAGGGLLFVFGWFWRGTRRREIVVVVIVVDVALAFSSSPFFSLSNSLSPENKAFTFLLASSSRSLDVLNILSGWKGLS